MVGFNFAPSGWLNCDGSLQPISEYETLFNLIGTTYGGDGQSTFAMPDLRGRIPLHFGNSTIIGEMAGTETVTLTSSQMATHNHALIAVQTTGNLPGPASNLLAEPQVIDIYSGFPSNIILNPQTVTLTGGNQPHENMQPFLCIRFIISPFGIFPSQT